MKRCNKGHADFYLNGDCRVCDRAYQAAYRRRRQAAFHLAQALERSGVVDLNELALSEQRA